MDKPGQEPHPSSSHVQQGLETPLIRRACDARKIERTNLRYGERVPLGDAEVIVDGWLPGDPALALEVFAFRGTLKAGQKKKLRSDLLKMAAIGQGPELRRAIIVADPTVEKWLRSGWTGEAARIFGIEIWLVDLLPEELKALDAARTLQRQGMAPRE